MAGLFDDKSGLRPPPMMGKKARTKLNKHNTYRMPPNLKGATAAAKGGLGGAFTSGKKMAKVRGFSGKDGSFVTPTGGTGLDYTPIDIKGAYSPMPIEDEDDDEISGGLASDGYTAQEIQADPSLMDDVYATASANLARPRMEAANAAKQAEYAKIMGNLKPPGQGGLNLPLLQFAAGMLSPTKTGSFGESLGYGIGSGVSGAQKQREQEQEFQKLQANLGLGAADAAYKGAYNLEALDQQRDIAELNKQARIDAANIGANARMAAKTNKSQDNINENADKANINLGEQLQKSSDASRELTEGLTQLEGILPDLPENPTTNWIAEHDITNTLPITKAKSEADKIIKQVILPKVKSLGVNPSNRDLQFTADAFVKSGSTRRSNERALLSGQLFATRAREINDIYNEMYADPYFAENPRKFKRELNKRIDELPSIAEQVEAKFPDEKKAAPKGGMPGRPQGRQSPARDFKDWKIEKVQEK